ncbi:MAG: hypothetical protein Q8N88_01550 [Nanoarchaeota archaeon]|nr:hypothetical protein [Nanoarchaeota archaeon]
MNLSSWFDKNYKKVLILPAVLLALTLVYLIFFYVQTGDIIYKDISLTGGSVITVSTTTSPSEMNQYLSANFTDFTVGVISDNSGSQIQLVITVPESEADALQSSLENFLGYELTDKNSSIETTSASLSQDFYKQLIVSVLLAFFWMSAVIFIIYAKGSKPKIWAIVINILFGIFMANFFLSINQYISFIIFVIFSVVLIRLYIKHSIPAIAVIFAAFADIVMTLAVVDLIGMKLSIAGIVSFLMLIGYSVDTDVLLTSRLTNKKEKTANQAIYSAFKTGITMTLTAIVAVTTALIIVYRFQSVLNQIFIILIIGLVLDIFNTWVTNVCLIKWYSEKR